MGRVASVLLGNLAIFGGARTAWACSGRGAEALVQENLAMGWVLFALTVVLAAAFRFVPVLRSLGRRWFWCFALLAAVHPGWWQTASGGDCGVIRVSGALAVTGMAALIAGVLVMRAFGPTKKKT